MRFEIPKYELRKTVDSNNLEEFAVETYMLAISKLIEDSSLNKPLNALFTYLDSMRIVDFSELQQLRTKIINSTVKSGNSNANYYKELNEWHRNFQESNAEQNLLDLSQQIG